MTQKVLRSPFAGIDFTGENQSSGPQSGQVITFNNDVPSFPVDPPTKINTSRPNQFNPAEPFPVKNFSLPTANQELSGNISLIGGGYQLGNSKNTSDILDEPPLLEGILNIKKGNLFIFCQILALTLKILKTKPFLF